jgi:hypothetical protein
MAADILPITSEVAEQFAHIFANLRRRGRPIDTNDIWIAAIARVHNLVVVTNDDHFQYVEGLQVENWSKTSASGGGAGAGAIGTGQEVADARSYQERETQDYGRLRL